MTNYVVTAIGGCPHGCGPLRGADDAYICPKCGDEWSIEGVEDVCDVAGEAAARAAVYDAVSHRPHRPGEATRISESVAIPGRAGPLRGGAVIVIERADERTTPAP
jgi:hypothetical protein